MKLTQLLGPRTPPENLCPCKKDFLQSATRKKSGIKRHSLRRHISGQSCAMLRRGFHKTIKTTMMRMGGAPRARSSATTMIPGAFSTPCALASQASVNYRSGHIMDLADLAARRQKSVRAKAESMDLFEHATRTAGMPAVDFSKNSTFAQCMRCAGHCSCKCRQHLSSHHAAPPASLPHFETSYAFTQLMIRRSPA